MIITTASIILINSAPLRLPRARISVRNKQSGMQILGPKIGAWCSTFWHLHDIKLNRSYILTVTRVWPNHIVRHSCASKLLKNCMNLRNLLIQFVIQLVNFFHPLLFYVAKKVKGCLGMVGRGQLWVGRLKMFDVRCQVSQRKSCVKLQTLYRASISNAACLKLKMLIHRKVIIPKFKFKVLGSARRD
jgi:hypothetical protein